MFVRRTSSYNQSLLALNERLQSNGKAPAVIDIAPDNLEDDDLVGAIGIMQIMPATGRELKVGDITQLEPNIHGGVKYMRQMENTYFANQPIDP